MMEQPHTTVRSKPDLLPTVDFLGKSLSRLVVGANPFAGFSHQSPARDAEMREYYTAAKIRETWDRAEAAGINVFITNNESPTVVDAVKQHLSAGTSMTWITQVNCRLVPDMRAAIDEAVEIGCSALYFHGALTDALYVERNGRQLAEWCEYARSHGIPVGVAAHAPEAHLWVDSLGLVDFHAVCFFNCGSLHDGKGEKFHLSDVPKAVAAIKAIKKPCIAYKIMGAGRIDARMAFEHAFDSIKPSDLVNVGMHRGDNDRIVEENAGIVREILARDGEE